MTMAMESFANGELIIAIRYAQSGAIRLDWGGKSNARDPAAVLAPLFGDLLAEARASGNPVEMHFERLEHFNSSTITALILFIQQLRQNEAKLAIVYDPRLKWQKLSFDALRMFATDNLLEIREEKGAA